MQTTAQFLQLLLLVLVFGTPVFMPVIFCIYWRKRRVSFRRSVLWLSGGMFATWMSLFSYQSVRVGPWQSGALAAGSSPDGHEYLVVQTYGGFFERYRVSFYIRDSNGIWHWNYLGHENDSWGKIQKWSSHRPRSGFGVKARSSEKFL